MADLVRRRSVASAIAWTLALCSVPLAVPSIALRPLSAGFSLFAVVFAATGAIIVDRQRRNRIGWLFVALGVAAALSSFTWAYATYGLFVRPGTLPEPLFAAWVYSWARPSLTVAALTVLPLIFPTGRPASRRWRFVLWADVLLVGAAVAHYAFGADSISFDGDTRRGIAANPFAIPLLVELTRIDDLTYFASLLFPLASVASLVWRYVHAHGVERQQIKWFAYSGLVAVTGVVVALFSSLLGSVLFFTGLLALPVAAAIAILRYRLYDIDILINRTVLYVSVTAVLAAAFAALSAVSQRTVEAVTGERSDLVTVALVLVVALGFAPLRRRIQPLVDRVLPGRGLLTLLFTDIVGSTERVVALGDERWRTVLEAYRAAVRRELARFGGREVDTAGDGFFATFERPTQGVRCAVALRDALHTLGLDSRVGLHIGECELRGEKVSGINVIVAARIMATAKANEIVVSRELRDLLASADFGFRDRGTESLKGVPGEWPLSSVEIGLAPA